MTVENLNLALEDYIQLNSVNGTTIILAGFRIKKLKGNQLLEYDISNFTPFAVLVIEKIC